MPHKTRKEKIIAELRRKVTIQSQQDVGRIKTPLAQENEPSRQNTSSSFSFKPHSEVKNSGVINGGVISSLVTYDYRYVVSDLRRTFFFAGFVLLIEFVLYWALELGGTQFLSSILKR